MPTPRKNEKKQNFMSRCIRMLMEDENKPQDQAIAICNSLWEQHKKKKEE